MIKTRTQLLSNRYTVSLKSNAHILITIRLFTNIITQDSIASAYQKKKGLLILMKKIQFFTFILLLASIFSLSTGIATAQLKATLEGHTDLVWSVAFSQDGRTLASGSQDRTIRLWNPNNGNLKRTLTGHRDAVNSVAFSPDGTTLASGSWDGTIRLWNPNNGNLKRTLTGHTDGISFVAFSPNGRILASASGDRTIRLWNPNNGKHIRTLTGHTNMVDSVAFSPDGQTLASGSRDQTIHLWDPNSGNLKTTLTGHTDDISRMMFSPDGRTLASGSRDGTIRLWNPNNGKLKEALAVQAGWIRPVAFSPNGTSLLIGGQGIAIWDTETGEYKKTLARDIGDALSVIFSSDGRMVASGSADHKVRVWEFNAFDYEFPSITRNPMVRLIHFIPNDRSVQPERVSALRHFIKDTQQFFADEMQSHGFGSKTFSVETDKSREPVVHRINGKFPDDHYSRPGLGWKVWTEVREHFDDTDLQDILLVIIDGKELGGEGNINYYDKNIGVDGIQPSITPGEEGYGGFAVVAVADDDFIRVTAHELGHAFGLLHDFREAQNNDYLMGYGSQSRLSKCSAEWLSVSHFFNTKPISPNKPTDIELLSTQAYNQNTVSLRFKVTDPDGLHHVQLLLPELNPDGEVSVPRNMFDCKQLKDKTSTFESAVRIEVLIDRVTLQVMDVNGNITWATFPIELDTVLSERNILDINSDGVVNTSDLTRIASRLEQRGNNPADVNEDKVVSIADLLLVAASIPSVSPQEVKTLIAADVQEWLTDAKQLRIENEYQQKGIVFLEYLSAEIVLLSKPTRVAKTPLKAVFASHADLVNSVAFSPDGQMLATGSTDNTIRLWDTHTAALKMLLIGHTDLINSVAFSPDGQTLASASPDTTVRLWDPHTGEHKTSLRAHSGFGYIGFYSVAFSPDGQTIAAGGDYNDPDIRLWDLHNEKNVRTLTGHKNRISSIAFSPDGRTLASGSWDETIKLWNPNNGNLKRTLTGHTRVVESVTFSPDGQTLASASRDGTIRLWNPQTGGEKKTLTGNTDWIEQIAFSPDGEILVSGSQEERSIRFWDIQTGEYTDVHEDDARSVMAVAFSPDGEILASSRANATVQLWDVQMLLGESPDPVVPEVSEDVNNDGVVNILDLVSVSANFGKTGENTADVNGDGIVNIVDLVKVAAAMGAGAAAPSAHPQTLEILTATDVRHWLTQAQHFGLTDATSQRGLLVLQQLLAALIPKETSLLANYPNPFNPETWIPYQLAKPAEVLLHIYAVDGRLVRRLALGHQPAGMYQGKNCAAYWDGRNTQGEIVASGVYFYTLTTGKFTATRKMLIKK